MTEVTSNFAYDSLASIRKRLLDLSSRNALLNYKFPKGKSIQFTAITPNQIFDMINRDVVIDLLAVPTPTNTQLKDYYLNTEPSDKDKQNLIPSAEKWAKYLAIDTIPTDNEHNAENVLQTLLYSKDLDTRAKYIRQQSESAMSETGSNILYLAIGFLEWKENQDSALKRLAPLFTLYDTPQKLDH